MFTRSDGRRSWISISTEPVENGGGAPFGVAVTFADLGTLRRVTARARACEEAGRLMQAISGTILMRCRPDLTVVSASGPVAQLLGRTPDELVGSRCTDWVADDDRQAVRDVHLHALESRDSVGIDHGIHDGSGTLVAVSRVVRAVRDPSTGEVEEVASLVCLANNSRTPKRSRRRRRPSGGQPHRKSRHPGPGRHQGSGWWCAAVR